jgi:hypothetical protein
VPRTSNDYVASFVVNANHSHYMSGCETSRSRLRAGFRCTTIDQMAAHRTIDQSRVYLCAGGLCASGFGVAVGIGVDFLGGGGKCRRAPWLCGVRCSILSRGPRSEIMTCMKPSVTNTPAKKLAAPTPTSQPRGFDSTNSRNVICRQVLVLVHPRRKNKDRLAVVLIEKVLTLC